LSYSFQLLDCDHYAQSLKSSSTTSQDHRWLLSLGYTWFLMTDMPLPPRSLCSTVFQLLCTITVT
jgi:hypothetical protein